MFIANVIVGLNFRTIAAHALRVSSISSSFGIIFKRDSVKDLSPWRAAVRLRAAALKARLPDQAIAKSKGTCRWRLILGAGDPAHLWYRGLKF